MKSEKRSLKLNKMIISNVNHLSHYNGKDDSGVPCLTTILCPTVNCLTPNCVFTEGPPCPGI